MLADKNSQLCLKLGLKIEKIHNIKINQHYTKKIWKQTEIIIFTYTNSLVNEIEIENVYDSFSMKKEMFDSSNYSVKLKYYDDLNALVVGKMKDEIDQLD